MTAWFVPRMLEGYHRYTHGRVVGGGLESHPPGRVDGAGLGVCFQENALGAKGGGRVPLRVSEPRQAVLRERGLRIAIERGKDVCVKKSLGVMSGQRGSTETAKGCN